MEADLGHGRKIRYHFRYDPVLCNPTQCFLTFVDPDGEEMVAAKVCVTRHYRDRYSKEAGRKAALSKAMRSIQVVPPSFADLLCVEPIGHPTTVMRKDARRFVWRSYLNRKPQKASARKLIVRALCSLLLARDQLVNRGGILFDGDPLINDLRKFLKDNPHGGMDHDSHRCCNQ